MIENQNNEVQTEHSSQLHIPAIQGEKIYGPVSNTNVAMFIFFLIVLVFSLYAKKALSKENSKLKTWLLHLLGTLDKNMSDTLESKTFARSYFTLIAGFLVVILFGNLFGLIIDWLWMSISPTILQYLRPINWDLNTTLVLALITVFSLLRIAIKTSWVWVTAKWYFFNFTWNSFAEKCINVFVWWLHLVSVPSTVAWLSLRLFWNIFAGMILIWVITYLWVLMTEMFLWVGRIIALPFWFFEIFVSLIQAIVFYMLMMSYFNQSKNSHH